MTLLFDTPCSKSLAFSVVADDGQIVRARIDGRLAHRFANADATAQPAACMKQEACTQEAVTDVRHLTDEEDDLTTDAERQDEPLSMAIGSEAYRRRVLLNLSAVTGMDTSGVNWLLTLQRRMNAVGGRLILHSLSPAVRTVVRVLNLHGALRVALDETDAALRA
jgi:anti-anti-sigma factor